MTHFSWAGPTGSGQLQRTTRSPRLTRSRVRTSPLSLSHLPISPNSPLNLALVTLKKRVPVLSTRVVVTIGSVHLPRTATVEMVLAYFNIRAIKDRVEVLAVDGKRETPVLFNTSIEKQGDYMLVMLGETGHSSGEFMY